MNSYNENPASSLGKRAFGLHHFSKEQQHEMTQNVFISNSRFYRPYTHHIWAERWIWYSRMVKESV
jgi:hypothetical protein